MVAPRYAVIEFAKVSGKQLRVRPASDDEKAPRLTEVEIRVKGKKGRR